MKYSQLEINSQAVIFIFYCSTNCTKGKFDEISFICFVELAESCINMFFALFSRYLSKNNTHSALNLYVEESRYTSCDTSDIKRMPCRDFTCDDIVTICCDIIRRDNIRVKQPQLPAKKKSIFSRSSSSTSDVSALARRLSVANGIPSVYEGVSGEPKENRKLSVDSSVQRMKMLNNKNSKSLLDPNQNVPGLHGRDIVTMAILVNDNGAPIRAYTEADAIPSEEVDAADRIFLARVPSVKNDNSNIINEHGEETVLLSEILSNMDQKQNTKLLKRLDKILMRLHTTDLNTALSFLKVERYADVRKELKEEILTFACKDLKLIM